MWCASLSSCRSRAPRSFYLLAEKGPSRALFFLVLVNPRTHLAAKDAIREELVADDERQHDERADAEERERALVRRGLPDREPVHHDVGEQAVGEAGEGEREDRRCAGIWLPVRARQLAPHVDARA